MDNYRKSVEYNKKILKDSEYFISKYKNFYNKLDKSDLEGLSYYKGDGYYMLNYLLNNNKLSNEYLINYIKKSKDGKEVTMSGLKDYVKFKINKLLENILKLEKVFQKAPKSDKKLSVFRGITETDTKIISQYKVGDKIKFNSYTSTSFSPKISVRFMKNRFTKKLNCCFMVIEIPKNVKMIYLPWVNQDNNKQNLTDHTFDGDEFELLLPRGCEFVVTKIDKVKTTDLFLNYNKKYKELQKDILSNNKTSIYYLKYIGEDPNKLDFNADNIISTINKVCMRIY